MGQVFISFLLFLTSVLFESNNNHHPTFPALLQKSYAGSLKFHYMFKSQNRCVMQKNCECKIILINRYGILSAMCIKIWCHWKKKNNNCQFNRYLGYLKLFKANMKHIFSIENQLHCWNLLTLLYTRTPDAGSNKSVRQ